MIHNVIFWGLVSIPTGYVMSVFINDLHVGLYKKPISNDSKHAIMASIIFLGLQKGYTGDDLVTTVSRFNPLKI